MWRLRARPLRQVKQGRLSTPRPHTGDTTSDLAKLRHRTVPCRSSKHRFFAQEPGRSTDTPARDDPSRLQTPSTPTSYAHVPLPALQVVPMQVVPIWGADLVSVPIDEQLQPHPRRSTRPAATYAHTPKHTRLTNRFAAGETEGAGMRGEDCRTCPAG